MNPQLVITLIGSLVPLVNNVLTWIEQARTTLKQSAELTPEQEAELDGHIENIDKPSWWKVEE